MVDTPPTANPLPRHVAVIMDGNGRWARERGEDRIFGHAHGVERAIRGVCRRRARGELLTLYAFPRELVRPQAEINALMELLVESPAGRSRNRLGVIAFHWCAGQLPEAVVQPCAM